MEQWKVIKGFPSYEISDLGNARRTKTKKPVGAWLVANGTGRPHLAISLYSDWRKGKYVATVHKIVMSTFVGPRPSGLVVNHKDGNPLNNALSNLEYVTSGENNQHAYDLGLKKMGIGEENHRALFTNAQYFAIVAEYKPWVMTLGMLAKKYGVGRHTISAIIERHKLGKGLFAKQEVEA